MKVTLQPGEVEIDTVLCSMYRPAVESITVS